MGIYPWGADCLVARVVTPRGCWSCSRLLAPVYGPDSPDTSVRGMQVCLGLGSSKGAGQGLWGKSCWVQKPIELQRHQMLGSGAKPIGLQMQHGVLNTMSCALLTTLLFASVSPALIMSTAPSTVLNVVLLCPERLN